jgi:hypothetical protein
MCSYSERDREGEGEGMEGRKRQKITYTLLLHFYCTKTFKTGSATKFK